MRRFFRRYPAVSLFFAADLVLLGLHLLLRGSRVCMNFLVERITQPFKTFLGAVTEAAPFSVAELVYVCVFSALALWLGYTVKKLLFSQKKGAVLGAFLLRFACIALSVYTALTLLWGVNYYADSFQDKSGIRARACSVEELEALTRQFAEGVAETYGEVKRYENGIFAESREDIFAWSEGAYDVLTEEFPFLDAPGRTPKGLVFSTVFSAMEFTGFFFPFTGEANLNVDSPAVYLPMTVLHEMSHQRGVASEQECNFLGILGAISSENPVYQYSGYLMGYVYLGNALYSVAPEKWQAIRDTVPQEAVTDLRYHSYYWQQWEGPVGDAASDAYDSFLKDYGDENGVRSYGMVTDLLIAYYLGN